MHGGRAAALQLDGQKGTAGLIRLRPAAHQRESLRGQIRRANLQQRGKLGTQRGHPHGEGEKPESLGYRNASEASDAQLVNRWCTYSNSRSSSTFGA